MNDLEKICETSEIKEKGFYVYKGLSKKGKLLYIGTTIQIPKDGFRWHKHNGKNFNFEIIKICENENEMLDIEYQLIKKYRPQFNKIKDRKQNFNIPLSEEELENRKGKKEWCQCCLKRHVNPGYEFCYFCEKGGY